MNSKLRLIIAALVFTFAASANAVLVEVRIAGTVEFNQINTGVLQSASSGDAVSLVFQVDSDDFTDSTNFPVRGYQIIASSFSFTAGGSTVGIADPFPTGLTPYFVIRNDDPAVDGFFLGTNIDGFPNGIPSDSLGLFDFFSPNFSVSYDQDPLPSLDILDALGTYDFTGGLTSFNFTVTDGPFDAMAIGFENMTITQIPVPGAVWLLGSSLFALLGISRRRTRV